MTQRKQRNILLRLVNPKKKKLERQRTNWRDFEVHHLIVIQGEMDGNFENSLHKIVPHPFHKISGLSIEIRYRHTHYTTNIPKSTLLLIWKDSLPPRVSSYSLIEVRDPIQSQTQKSHVHSFTKMMNLLPQRRGEKYTHTHLGQLHNECFKTSKTLFHHSFIITLKKQHESKWATLFSRGLLAFSSLLLSPTMTACLNLLS